MFSILQENGTIEKIDKVIKIGKISILASVIKSIQTRYEEAYTPLFVGEVKEKYFVIIEELDGKENIQEYDTIKEAFWYYKLGRESWEKWMGEGLFIPVEIMEGE